MFSSISTDWVFGIAGAVFVLGYTFRLKDDRWRFVLSFITIPIAFITDLLTNEIDPVIVVIAIWFVITIAISQLFGHDDPEDWDFLSD